VLRSFLGRQGSQNAQLRPAPFPALQDQRKPTRPRSRHHGAVQLGRAARIGRCRRERARRTLDDRLERGVHQDDLGRFDGARVSAIGPECVKTYLEVHHIQLAI